MPSAPPMLRQSGRKPRAVKERERKARVDAKRQGDPVRSWYWSKRWRAERVAFLAAHPLCRECERKGRIVPAAVVDHIVPHKGNEGAFWDAGNWQPLCKPCHDAKTAREDGGFVGHSWHPEWLMPPRVPLVIVCGPPASGKNTYVAGHAGRNDLVIDLDAIGSELSGLLPCHDWNRDNLGRAVRRRNSMVQSLSSPSCGYDAGWLIVSEPAADRRQWWADKLSPKSIVVMETPAHICVERVRVAEDRAARLDREVGAIGKWWDRYERRKGDIVIACG